MTSKYWVNNVYGLGVWLKDYGYYPSGLPLCNYMDHGMTFSDHISPHEIDNDAPVIFKFSPRHLDEYKKRSKKPVYCLLNPTIHYRIKNKIKQKKDAAGTLFFVAHSTPDIDDQTNWDEFIVNLDNISEQFKPIDICIHHHDVAKGLDVIFKNKGFKVVSAGNPYANNYIENFYSILSCYKYTMSNLLGSYAFYSVEMGTPFSCYGEDPVYLNKGDKNLETGIYVSYKDHPSYQMGLQLFKGYHTQITEDQTNFINKNLGKYDTISRVKTCMLLYKALFKFMSKHPHTIKPVMKSVLNMVKAKFTTRSLMVPQ